VKSQNRRGRYQKLPPFISIAWLFERPKCKNSDSQIQEVINTLSKWNVSFCSRVEERRNNKTSVEHLLRLISFDLVFSSPYREFISTQGDLFTDHVCHWTLVLGVIVLLTLFFPPLWLHSSTIRDSPWLMWEMCRKQLFTVKVVFVSRANIVSFPVFWHATHNCAFRNIITTTFRLELIEKNFTKRRRCRRLRLFMMIMRIIIAAPRSLANENRNKTRN
jgi:hypothetical protein